MENSHASQSNTDLISVIVPVYNIKDYLRRCVESILRQTYENIEVLLVDDGSTDGSGELCDELAAGDPRVRVFHKENGGSSAARNLAIENAKGTYLGFVDSDDHIAPDMYEKLHKALTGSNIRLAQIARDEIAEDGTILPDICIPPEKPTTYTAEEFLKEMLLHKGDASMCTKLIHRDLLGDHRFPEGKLNEDFRVLVEILSEFDTAPTVGKAETTEDTTPALICLPYRGYHVFYKSGSNSRTVKTRFSRVFYDCVENADLCQKLAVEKYPDLVPVALRFGLFQRLEYLLHIPVRQMTKDNVQYQEVKDFVKRHKKDIDRFPGLSIKNRTYLKIFATLDPHFVRWVHAKLKGFEI